MYCVYCMHVGVCSTLAAMPVGWPALLQVSLPWLQKQALAESLSQSGGNLRRRLRFPLTPNLCACNGSDSLGSDSEEVCVIRHVDITFLHSRDIAEKSKVVNPLDKVNIHETLDYWWSSQRWRRSEEVFQGRILPNITHVGTERNGAQAESIHCCKMWRSIKLNKWSKLWELAQSTMSKIFFLIWISSLFKFRCKWVNFEIIHFLVHAYALLQYHCLEYYYYWLLITAAAAGQEVEETWREIGREFQIKKNSVTQKKRVRVLVSLNY